MRDTRIDSLRVIAILSVLLTHAINAPYLSHPTRAPLAWAVVYSIAAAYNVQLFMFFSGWLAKADAGLRWVGGRVTRLVVPYLAWCVVQFAVFYRSRGLAYLPRMFADPTATNALWFLPALFLCSAAFALLRRWPAALVAVAAVLVFAAPTLTWFGIAKAGQLFPFFVAGHFAGRTRRRWDPRALAWASPLLVAAAWSRAGVGLPWGAPAWYAAATHIGGALLPTLAWGALALARFGASLSLIAVLAWAVGFGRGGVAAAVSRVSAAARHRTAGLATTAWRWLGRNTLGLYVCHIFFLRLLGGTGSVGIVAAYASALVGGVALTAALGLARPTSRLFLGCPSGVRVGRAG